MVLQKRLDYGFSGYQVPWVPRASRSPRGRGSSKKKLEDDRIYAFEVLASLAGKLLQERETSASISDASRKNQQTVVKCETHDKGHQIKLEPRDENTLAYVPHANDDLSLKISSTINSDLPENVCFSDKLDVDCRQKARGSSPSKVAGDFPCCGIFFEGNVDTVIEKNLEVEPQEIRGMVSKTHPKKGSSKDLGELDRATLAPVHLDNNAKASLFSDHMNCGPSPRCQENMEVVSGDDDENSSGCSQPGTIMKTYTPRRHIGNQRIRKLSASRCWGGTPNLKDGGFLNTDRKRKPVYWTWKTCYPRRRSQRISPFKRRKLLDQNPESTSDRGLRRKLLDQNPESTSDRGLRRKLLDQNLESAFDRGFSCAGMYNSHNKGKKSENSSAGGASSSVAGQQAPSHSRDCNVKLSIKSFRVPELFVEIPATATVGSLKRTVMEAVTAVLGGGLHVGILLQGKKVGDDSKTLLQSGISQGDKLRTLGFMLEPRCTQIPPSLCAEDPAVFLHGCTPQHLTSFSTTPTSGPGTSKISPDPPVTNLSKCVQRNHDTAPSHTDISTDKTIPESRALLAVPSVSLKPLAMVPFHQKSRRPEFVQRRIRRPFSVSEVEALVQAVENLGTGRWRDVKLCAFDGAKHRTYVDLKSTGMVQDKWKTLVHTAKISPQQRRGEPVPQELLDRVLAAHAYWSQQQVKVEV
ncbi:Telomere repeat-binding protein 5 [Vitis vinifera]|uniref:Telomere repeat-binding protein 5 n=1 Tax=Vitis vinifera TaxID=29760 RepID=A0A438DE26_VITVI|nr:Telomere repeat-binding protein 5 [Vitis vinifera]